MFFFPSLSYSLCGFVLSVAATRRTIRRNTVMHSQDTLAYELEGFLDSMTYDKLLSPILWGAGEWEETTNQSVVCYQTSYSEAETPPS
jgi:hypothetical protein